MPRVKVVFNNPYELGEALKSGRTLYVREEGDDRSFYEYGEFMFYSVIHARKEPLEAAWEYKTWYEEVQPRHHHEIAKMFFEDISLKCEFLSLIDHNWVPLNYPSFTDLHSFRLKDKQGVVVKESPAKSG